MMDDDELWCTIPDFPSYSVSSHGEILNLRTRRLMRVSQSNFGNTKVSLIGEDGVRHTKSVAPLVAEAFIERPDDFCNQVMLLDGNNTNVWAYNLVWRPRHFAWKYTRQLHKDQPLHYYNLSVQENGTGAIYPSVVDAAMTEGLLFDDIWRSTYTGVEIYPTQSVYEIVDRV